MQDAYHVQSSSREDSSLGPYGYEVDTHARFLLQTRTCSPHLYRWVCLAHGLAVRTLDESVLLPHHPVAGFRLDKDGRLDVAV